MALARAALNIIFFFFSSRRRHTRSLCDWSSDVCSSDLRDHEVIRMIEIEYSMKCLHKIGRIAPVDLRIQCAEAKGLLLRVADPDRGVNDLFRDERW